MCCRKLRNLVKTKRIKRDRFSMLTPYFYYLEKQPKRVEHRVGVNWMFTYFKLKNDDDLKLQSFSVEPRIYEPIVEPDAFVIIKDYASKDHFYFIEFHREESGNGFDKIPKYDALFKKIFNDKLEGRKSYYWVDPAIDQTFSLIIVTTGDRERIISHVRNEKVYGYKVQVMSISKLKELCTEMAHKKHPNIALNLAKVT